MARDEQAKDLFTASEVARFCQVDLKTIHNWADRGEIKHFRTPGRHLRFRRADVLDFLRRYGYPVPGALQDGRPSVMVLHQDDATRDEVVRGLGCDYDVDASADPLSTLVGLGAAAPDVLVVGTQVDGIDAARLVACLGTHEATEHVRTIVCGGDGHDRKNALDAGASAFVRDDDLDTLEGVLGALLGTKR